MVRRPSAKTPHFALHCLVLPPDQAPRVRPVPCPTAFGITHSDVAALPNAPLLSLFPQNGLWMGAVVPKRWAKRAVTRNMIKRQVLQLKLPQALRNASMALVVRLRTGFDNKQFKSASSPAIKAQVRMELTQLFAALTLPMQTVPIVDTAVAGSVT